MMQPTLTEKNSTFLNRHLPSVADHIPKIIPDDIELLQSRRGPLTAKYRDVLLHSIFDPHKEAKRFVDGNDIHQGGTLLLYGLGLGYHVLEAANKLGPAGRLIVIELNTGIVRAALEVIDLESLHKTTQCELILPDTAQAVAARIDQLTAVIGSEQCTVLVHGPSFKCIPEQFVGMSRFFKTGQMERRTAGVFKKQYHENFLKNTDTVLSAGGTDRYKDNFRGKPAILIGAGPSLDESVCTIKKYADRAVIMAVDTAFAILMRHGIRPDFVVSVDPQPITLRHFDGLWDARVPLIITPVSCAQVVARYGGPFVVILQKDHSYTGKFESYLAGKGITRAGGSVSCIAFDILAQWGCNPVIFAGMDYAYPLYRAYSRFAFESVQLHGTTNRFFTDAAAHRRRINNDEAVYVQSYADEQVRTSSSLCAYKKNIENLVALYRQNVTTYTISAAGAKINGVEAVAGSKLDAVFAQRIDKHVAFENRQVDPSLKETILATLQ